MVGSILLAFALDAWWDHRQLAQELRQELQSVRQECEENQRRVAQERTRLAQVVAANRYLLSVLDAAPTSSTVLVQDTVAWLVTSWAPSLDVSFGAVDALISSGHLGALDNLELRIRLSGLRGRIDDAVEEEIFARQLMATLYLPSVGGSLDFAPLSKVDDAVAVSWQTGDRFPSFGSVAFPNRLEVKNAIRARLVWYAAASAEMEDLLAELVELAGLADAEVS